MKDNNDATFQGGCLCGAYKFQVKNLEAGWQPRRCNCAICRKKGALWVAPPSQDDFIILKDDGNLKSYTFGPKNWSHEFCETCGVNVKVSTLGSGWPMAVNLRALDEAEKLYSREWNKIGGKAWGIVYEPKSYTGELPPGQEDDTEIVNGSCHCGAVTYAAKVKSVEDVKPQSNGSALLSHGILVLPLKNDIQFRMNETNLREYTTKDGLTKVMFCRTCGVPVQAQSPSENNSVLLNLRTLDVEGLDEKWCMNI